MVSGFTLEKLGPRVAPPYWFIEDWTRFCYVIGFENFHSPFTRYRICSDLFFPLCESGLKKYPDSPDARGRKPYPKRKSCGFKTIRTRVDGALAILAGRNERIRCDLKEMFFFSIFAPFNYKLCSVYFTPLFIISFASLFYKVKEHQIRYS